MAVPQDGYLSEDTIAAVATAVGGAIAIVRISGPDALETLQTLVPGLGAIEPRRAFRAQLRDPATGAALDDAVVVVFFSPASFTGENVVELHIHGGGYVSRRIMEVLHRLGVRQALPGEFSFRAVRNGKMSVAQAAAVADLIAATNDDALSLALEKLSGSQNQLLSGIAGGLRELAALGEVGIDFSDQDVEEVQLPALRHRLVPLLASLRDLRSSYHRGSRIQEGIRAAVIGLPNAGKSTFFNAILGEDRSIVSELPGTTRDVVHEKLTLRNARTTLTLRLEDTAGLRSTESAIERTGIERSRRAARDADLVLLLVDTSSPIAPALEQWRSLGIPAEKTLGFLTKTDLPPVDTRPSFAQLGIDRWVETSALMGDGISEAIDAIVGFCHGMVYRERGEVVLTRLDQLNAVTQAICDLERAQFTKDLDLFASDLRQALHNLGPLIGETLTDDILGQIFSEFCIGK